MTPLESAIAIGQDQIDSYHLGTTSQPQPGTTDYFQLRAVLIGQAYLLRLRDVGVENDVAAVERLYRTSVSQFSRAPIPPPEEKQIERVPVNVELPAGVPAPT